MPPSNCFGQLAQNTGRPAGPFQSASLYTAPATTSTSTTKECVPWSLLCTSVIASCKLLRSASSENRSLQRSISKPICTNTAAATSSTDTSPSHLRTSVIASFKLSWSASSKYRSPYGSISKPISTNIAITTTSTTSTTTTTTTTTTIKECVPCLASVQASLLPSNCFGKLAQNNCRPTGPFQSPSLLLLPILLLRLLVLVFLFLTSLRASLLPSNSFGQLALNTGRPSGPFQSSSPHAWSRWRSERTSAPEEHAGPAKRTRKTGRLCQCGRG